MSKYINENIKTDDGDIKNFETILKYMLELGASDVFIASGKEVIIDLHGFKRVVSNGELTFNCVETMIKAIDGDNAIARLYTPDPINKAYQLNFQRDKKNFNERFRINIVCIQSKGKSGFQLTVRHIPQNIPSLIDLGLDNNHPIYKDFFPLQGLVLVAGATGSGKSTLMASCLAELLKGDYNKIINTYEQPIEYVFDAIKKGSSEIFQSSVPDMVRSFTDGIKESLRRKPDIIMVGELRDKETIEVALEACQTGHLVIGTVHTNGIAATIPRLINKFEGSERQSRQSDLIDSLQFVVSQRLLKTIDGKRTAAREFIKFDNDLKEQLLNCSFNQLSTTIKDVMRDRETGILLEAKHLFQMGKISEEIYKEIEQTYK